MNVKVPPQKKSATDTNEPNAIAIHSSRKRQADEISSTLQEKQPKTSLLSTGNIPVIIKVVVKALPNSSVPLQTGNILRGKIKILQISRSKTVIMSSLVSI